MKMGDFRAGQVIDVTWKAGEKKGQTSTFKVLEVEVIRGIEKVTVSELSTCKCGGKHDRIFNFSPDYDAPHWKLRLAGVST